MRGTASPASSAWILPGWSRKSAPTSRASSPATRCGAWGTHALAPLSFRAATYSGVFTLLPLLTGEGRAHHGEIMAEATKLVEAGKLVPRLDPRRFTLDEAADAHAAIADRSAQGKLVIDVAL